MHATQAAPFTPQTLLVCCVTQVLFWQHPGQFELLQLGVPTQENPLHTWAPVHTAQVLPDDPQALVKLPGWQIPPLSLQPWHGGVLQAPMTHA